MLRYDRPARAFAVCLAILAGYADAVGFISLGGFFVSFMSGNSTRLGVGLASGSREAATAAGLIAAFVGGVVAGALLGRLAARRRASLILGLVAALLAAASWAAGAGLGASALFLVAMAMGAENTVFEREGEVSIGVTYMTGALVKLGQRLAAALSGGDRLGWLPYLLLWLGLLGGAVAGTAAYLRLGLQALWIAALAAGLLAAAATRLPLTPDEAQRASA